MLNPAKGLGRDFAAQLQAEERGHNGFAGFRPSPIAVAQTQLPCSVRLTLDRARAALRSPHPGQIRCVHPVNQTR